MSEAGGRLDGRDFVARGHCTGALPQTPGFSAQEPSPKVREAAGGQVPPAVRSWTWADARVASQQSPTLRPGTMIVPPHCPAPQDPLGGWTSLPELGGQFFRAPPVGFSGHLRRLPTSGSSRRSWVDQLTRTEGGPACPSLDTPGPPLATRDSRLHPIPTSPGVPGGTGVKPPPGGEGPCPWSGARGRAPVPLPHRTAQGP